MDQNEQFIELFIEESKESLQTLNSCLLDFEKDYEDMDIIKEIFRMAHTLKGMSATMGFTVIATLTHKMENILDGIRAKKLKANQDIIDILFEGLDILEVQVRAIGETGKEEDMDISDISKRLEHLENFGGDTPTEDIIDEIDSQIKMPIEDVDMINSLIAKIDEPSLKVKKIAVVISEDSILKSARAFLVFKELEEIGDIIYSNPASEKIENEEFDYNFTLLLATKEESKVIQDKLLNISEIKEVLIEDFKSEEVIQTTDINNKTLEDIQKEIESLKNETGITQEVSNKKETKKQSKSVRVDIDRLDNLMNLVSELIIVKTRLEDNEVSANEQSRNEAVEYLERVTTNLHDAVTKVRMVPVERVFNRFPRMVRDLSKDLNKEINLTMKGEETEVDRTVIDEIGDPLIHLLRNSIDHGIEQPEVRMANGKSKAGHVSLVAYPDGNTVVIEVSDDGGGINTEKVKEKAIANGLITRDQASNMDDNKIAELIFEPGFSTADQISDISGRGVGLDVVKSKIQNLNGEVEIETTRGRGSRFIIRLPLTLAIIQALLIQMGDEKYAIPLNNIKEITNIKSNTIRLVEHKEVTLYRDKTLPLIRLEEVVNSPEPIGVKDEETVVIVKKGDKDLGVIIDSLIGQQEIVIKTLGEYLNGMQGIAGATILGNGNVALIIDSNSLF